MKTVARSRISSRSWSIAPPARPSANGHVRLTWRSIASRRSLKALGNVDVRVAETSREESETEGTRLFAALQGALADAPPERIGGAI